MMVNVWNDEARWDDVITSLLVYVETCHVTTLPIYVTLLCTSGLRFFLHVHNGQILYYLLHPASCPGTLPNRRHANMALCLSRRVLEKRLWRRGRCKRLERTVSMVQVWGDGTCFFYILGKGGNYDLLNETRLKFFD
jgi:hypothetical protein